MAPLPGHLQALLPEPSELGLKQIERIGNQILSLSRLRVSRSPVRFATQLPAEFTVDTSAFSAIFHGMALSFGCGFYADDSTVDLWSAVAGSFTERIPKVVRRYGRFTERSRQVLSLIGYALGGEAGARLAEHIGLETSADTVLRSLKNSAPEESHPPVRVVGVDDWAWRKGQYYGTILVDLERHKVVGLLLDRSARKPGTLAKERADRRGCRA